MACLYDVSGRRKNKEYCEIQWRPKPGRCLVHTIIPCIDAREQVLVLLDEIGQSGHQLAALCRGHQLPRWMHQCLLGSLDGAIRVFGASRMDGGNWFISPGIAVD